MRWKVILQSFRVLQTIAVELYNLYEYSKRGKMFRVPAGCLCSGGKGAQQRDGRDLGCLLAAAEGCLTLRQSSGGRLPG